MLCLLVIVFDLIYDAGCAPGCQICLAIKFPHLMIAPCLWSHHWDSWFQHVIAHGNNNKKVKGEHNGFFDLSIPPTHLLEATNQFCSSFFFSSFVEFTHFNARLFWCSDNVFNRIPKSPSHIFDFLFLLRLCRNHCTH